MQRATEQILWSEYCTEEYARAEYITDKLGFSLDSHQPFISGERFLMSGRKLVLRGVRLSDKRKVIIKISSNPDGKKELVEEYCIKEALERLPFAYHPFASPKEIFFSENMDHCTVLIVEYVEQDKPFLERPIKEQFSLALNAFKVQEGAHATTRSHTRNIESIFNAWNSKRYLTSAAQLKRQIMASLPENKDLALLLDEMGRFLRDNQTTIEQYSGFLTHTDFVPHNLRIHDGKVYLLDQTSLIFGNKYEGWARFLNFMLLYNRPLEQALVSYVKENRAPEESVSLQLMRAYKVVFLINFYAQSFNKTSGDLRLLTNVRVRFWSAALRSILTGEAIAQELIDEYAEKRDRLRSSEEKKRQEQLH